MAGETNGIGFGDKAVADMDGLGVWRDGWKCMSWVDMSGRGKHMQGDWRFAQGWTKPRAAGGC